MQIEGKSLYHSIITTPFQLTNMRLIWKVRKSCDMSADCEKLNVSRNVCNAQDAHWKCVHDTFIPCNTYDELLDFTRTLLTDSSWYTANFLLECYLQAQSLEQVRSWDTKWRCTHIWTLSVVHGSKNRMKSSYVVQHTCLFILYISVSDNLTATKVLPEIMVHIFRKWN